MVEFLTVNIMLGIFCIIAFATVAVMLKKYQLPWKSWLLLTLVVILLIIAEHQQQMVGNVDLHNKIFTTAMVFFALVALGQFWSVVRLSQ
ncbi:hypothetical protein GOV11_04885 [Candidatus Woesearchaeota archaeon]|nr:hypothetical protein [Candidatus Woesearchaeota archaeon]